MRTDARSDIAKLSRAASGGIVTLDSAVKTLGQPRAATARRLGALARAGWLSRIQRGVYSIRPIDATPDAEVAEEDPWSLAMRVFAPCYIGGWTAASHWHLTEQLFRVTLVVTSRRVRRSETVLGSSAFRVVRDSRLDLTGVTNVWRGSSRVPVSGVERTIVDACANPSWIGGGRQLVDVFRAAIGDGQMTPDSMMRTIGAAVSGAALGRLGMLVERYWPEASAVADHALQHRGKGYVRFDPAVRRNGPLNSRWGVWMNVAFDRESRDT